MPHFAIFAVFRGGSESIPSRITVNQKGGTFLIPKSAPKSETETKEKNVSSKYHRLVFNMDVRHVSSENGRKSTIRSRRVTPQQRV